MILEECGVAAQWYFGGVPVEIRAAGRNVVFLAKPASHPSWKGYKGIEAILARRPGGEHWRATLNLDNPNELRLKGFLEAWGEDDERAFAFWHALCETIFEKGWGSDNGDH